MLISTEVFMSKFSDNSDIFQFCIDSADDITSNVDRYNYIKDRGFEFYVRLDTASYMVTVLASRQPLHCIEGSLYTKLWPMVRSLSH